MHRVRLMEIHKTLISKSIYSIYTRKIIQLLKNINNQTWSKVK